MTYLSMADVRCIKAQHRRDARRAEGICINGPMPGNSNPHGPVVRGGKCQACIDVHRRTR